MGGWQIFRIQGDDLCRTMTFSRGVQTPENTMGTLGMTSIRLLKGHDTAISHGHNTATIWPFFTNK